MIFGISNPKKDDDRDNNQPCPQAIQNPETEAVPTYNNDTYTEWFPTWCVKIDTLEELLKLAREVPGDLIVDGSCRLTIFNGYYEEYYE